MRRRPWRFWRIRDALTRLPNRLLLRDRLAQALARASREGQPLALLFIDLNRFKEINDTLGHAVGDAVLMHAAQVMASAPGQRHPGAVGRR